jgi:hypothetical protein
MVTGEPGYACAGSEGVLGSHRRPHRGGAPAPRRGWHRAMPGCREHGGREDWMQYGDLRRGTARAPPANETGRTPADDPERAEVRRRRTSRSPREGRDEYAATAWLVSVAARSGEGKKHLPCGYPSRSRHVTGRLGEAVYRRFRTAATSFGAKAGGSPGARRFHERGTGGLWPKLG